MDGQDGNEPAAAADGHPERGPDPQGGVGGDRLFAVPDRDVFGAANEPLPVEVADAEVVHPVRARRARHRAVGPVGADRRALAVRVDLAVDDPVDAQVAADSLGGRRHNLAGVGELAEAVAECDEEGLPPLALLQGRFGLFLARDIHLHAEHPEKPSLIVEDPVAEDLHPPGPPCPHVVAELQLQRFPERQGRVESGLHPFEVVGMHGTLPVVELLDFRGGIIVDPEAIAEARSRADRREVLPDPDPGAGLREAEPLLALAEGGLCALLLGDVAEDDLDRGAPPQRYHGSPPLHRHGHPVRAEDVHRGDRALLAAKVRLDVPFDVSSPPGMDDLEDGAPDKVLRPCRPDEDGGGRVRKDDRPVLVDQDRIRRELDQVPVFRLALGELAAHPFPPVRAVPDGEGAGDHAVLADRGGDDPHGTGTIRGSDLALQRRCLATVQNLPH